MNVIGLYGAIGWNVLISDNPKLLKQSEESWTHGASVTLIKDGEHCVSISEERLSGIKYDGNFPRKSIEYCLSTANLDKNDIDVVIVPSMANQQFYKNYINKTVEKKVKRYFPKARVEIASHHLCHAYSSVFSCDYNEGSFVTLDNAGSILFDTTGQIFACENHSFGYFNKRKGLFKYYPGIPQTNNFGNYYWMWAYHIYVNKIQKDIQLTDPKYRETFCGKVMGLSAYGNIKEFKQDWRSHFEGIPQIALESFPNRDFNYGNLTPENKAKQLQLNFENAMLDYMKQLKEQDYINPTITFSSPAITQFTQGETITSPSGDTLMRAEVVKYSDSDKKIHLIHAGADDGKYHTFTAGKKVVGLTSGAGGVITLVVEDNQLSENEQNTDFSTSTDFIDFSETNPFGDASNN